jgi:hypothetical protein
MASAYGYGSYGGTTAMLSAWAQLLSLVFVAASFIVLLYLAAKVRTRRSFQFEMFLVALVLGAAEVPKISMDALGLNLGVLATYGLEVHSASMIILAGFVAYRIY